MLVAHRAVAVVIAVADSDDGFRLIALETLCELALINNTMVAQLGGFAVRLSFSIHPSPHRRCPPAGRVLPPPNLFSSFDALSILP